jgi:hypothetical protein
MSFTIVLGALGEGETGTPDFDILIEGSIEGRIEVVVIAVINLACGIVGCSTDLNRTQITDHCIIVPYLFHAAIMTIKSRYWRNKRWLKSLKYS